MQQIFPLPCFILLDNGVLHACGEEGKAGTQEQALYVAGPPTQKGSEETIRVRSMRVTATRWLWPCCQTVDIANFPHIAALVTLPHSFGFCVRFCSALYRACDDD